MGVCTYGPPELLCQTDQRREPKFTKGERTFASFWYDANNVRLVKRQTQNLQDIDLSVREALQHSGDELNDDWEQNQNYYEGAYLPDWTMTCNILRSFASEVVPSYCYAKLKLALLLSLLSNGRTQSADCKWDMELGANNGHDDGDAGSVFSDSLSLFTVSFSRPVRLIEFIESTVLPLCSVS